MLPPRSLLILSAMIAGWLFLVHPALAQDPLPTDLAVELEDAGEGILTDSGQAAAEEVPLPDIDTLLLELSEEDREIAVKAQRRYDDVAAELREVAIELRVTHIRYVNDEEPPRPLKRKFYELRWRMADLLTEQLRASMMLLRYLPVPEAAQFIVTEVQRRVKNDWLDEDTYEAASLLLQLNQQSLPLFLASARSAVVLGRFDMVEKLYEILKPEFYEDIDRRLIGTVDSMKAMYEAEQALLAKADRENFPTVRFETTRGPFVIELFTDTAPATCSHFLSLIEEGFYDSLDFGQVSEHLLALTGDPTGDGRGNAGRFVRDENPGQGHQPWRGAVILAKVPTGEGRFLANSASSQIAIPFLPLSSQGFDQTVIGRVIEGMGNVSMLRRVDPSKEKKSAVVVPPDRVISASIVRPPPTPLPEPDYLDAAELAQSIRAAMAAGP